MNEQAANDIPQRLRAARERTGMSLRQLARRLDISASALSQIETGKSRPSVKTLYAVVSELGLSLDELFAPASPTEPDAGGGSPAAAPVSARGPSHGESPVQRGDSRARIELDEGVYWDRLTTAHDPLVDFLMVTYEPGSTSNVRGRLVRHSGHEYGLVVRGTLDVTVGFETYHLEPGDSISFSSEEPHVLTNNGDTPTEAVWFVVGRRGSDPRFSAEEQ